MKKSTVLYILIFLTVSASFSSLLSLDLEVNALGESACFSRSEDEPELEALVQTDVLLSQPLFAGMEAELAFFLNYNILSTPDELEQEFYGDLLIARLKGSFGAVDYAAGRSRLQDFSSLILNTPADGIILGYNGGDVQLSAAAGITGLLLDSAAELIPTESEDDRGEPLFAPSRLLFLFGLDYPELFAGSLLHANFIVNFDIPEENDFTGDNYDSFTLGAGLDGTLLGSNFSLFCFVQQGNYYGQSNRDYLYTQSIAAAAGTELVWSGLMSSSDNLLLNITAASGDSSHPLFGDAGGGLSSQFMPVTRTDSQGVYDYVLSNLLRIETAYDFAPVPALPAFRTSASAAAVFRPSDGEGTFEKITDSDTPSGFMGSELIFKSEYAFESGFTLYAGGALFIPLQKYRDLGVFPDSGLPWTVSLGCSYLYNY